MESESSSDDEEQAIALQSVAVDSAAVLHSAALSANRCGLLGKVGNRRRTFRNGMIENEDDNGGLKLYHIRVQNLLSEYLDKSITFVEKQDLTENSNSNEEDFSPVCLLKNSGRQIRWKSRENRRIAKPPVACSGSSDEDTEFQSRLKSAAVDGTTVIAQAQKAQARALVGFLEATAAAEEAARREEARVAQLKRERGEEWLPSLAPKMKRTK